MKKAIEIQGASEMEVDFEHELKRLTRDGGLLKQEARRLKKSSCATTRRTAYREGRPFGS